MIKGDRSDRAEYLRSAVEAGREFHVLRLTVGHSVWPTGPSSVVKFRSGTWTLWIDRETALIWRAEFKERWERKVGPEEVKPFVQEIREPYRNQLINPNFTLEDLMPEPPDPVAPAAETPIEKPKPGEEAKQEAMPAPGEKPAQQNGEEKRARAAPEETAPRAAARWEPPAWMSRNWSG